MGRTSKWIKHLLTGKRDKEKSTLNQQQVSLSIDNATTPVSTRPTTPKEKRRWSFRRPSTTQTGMKEASNAEQPVVHAAEVESEQQKKHAMAVAMATAAAAEAAVAAAQAAAAVIRLASAAPGRASAVEEAAAIKIQSVFRSYLARKALCALKGLVKLQALVRGHLVRKQATSTLRYMHAMMMVQARARAQRIGIVDEKNSSCNHRHSTYRKSSHYDLMEENAKIVEMDIGDTRGTTKSRSSYSNHTPSEKTEHRYSTHGHFSKHDYQHISPAPSAITDMSPRTCSGHFEDYSFGTTQSNPQYYSAISQPDSSKLAFSYSRDYAESMSYEYSFSPNYMANTESSKAKVRSHSAPKQRPVDTFERQSSKRRPSIEGRNVPRAVRMQRSSSHISVTSQNYPWSIKLDKSAVSLKDSECGSNSTMLTNTNYCRSLVGFEVQANRY